MKEFEKKETIIEATNCTVVICELEDSETKVYVDTKNGDQVYMLRVVGNLKKGLLVYDW